MMRYLLYSLLLCCLILSAAWAYRVNYETRDVVRNIKALQIDIEKQEEKLIMLEGEWAYLNRPERLSLLSEYFFSDLQLIPISVENFAEIDAIQIKKPERLNQADGIQSLENAKIYRGRKND
tara:strand:+ start:1596 stop:1961 length:366 start_codon:yes stop_codon:yes gene_type:complete